VSTRDTTGDSNDQLLFEDLSRVNNELANTQRELVSANVKLGRLNAQKDRFLGMAAHDLRTPLGIIKAYSSFLRDESTNRLEEEQLEFLEEIHSCADFMLRLVDDLLDISKINSGNMEITLEPTDLLELAERVVRRNRLLAVPKDIEVLLKVEPERLSSCVDARMIEQVFNNLLSNAVKFSHPGSTVTVVVSRESNTVRVEVRDEGEGIPVNELDDVFAAFKKTSTKSTAGERSTGLGLAIVQRVVNAHDGKIWVTSELGRGSTFYFTLPLVEQVAFETEEAAIDVAEPPVPVFPSATHLRVVLAEDNPVNRKIGLRLLKKLGHKAIAVTNGVEALAELERAAYDVILMDIHMPEMDGLEATRLIRERFSEEDQPIVIAMTASLEYADSIVCRKAGMDDYVEKPVAETRLQEVLDRQMARRRRAS
jgi:CheY-like chemotaxis protein